MFFCLAQVKRGRAKEESEDEEEELKVGEPVHGKLKFQ